MFDKKKFMPIMLSFCIFGNIVNAAQPSGLKDVETSNELQAEAVIDVELKTKGSGLVVSDDIVYNVKLKAGADRISNFIVTASCGDVSETIEETIKANSSLNKEYTLKDCPIGENMFSVNVSCNGVDVGSYSQKVTITPEVPRYFLDEVTSKLGYNTPYDHSLYHDTISVNGARAMRTEFGRWSYTERKKGVYDFAHIDPYMKAVDKMDIEVLGMLGMNNSLYMDSGTGNGPDSKGNIDGFAQYAKHMSLQYPYMRHIEVWNEANIAFWVNPNARDYGYTAEVAYQEVNKVNPNVDIMVGGVAGGDANFLNNMMVDGLWANCDTVSYHPYTRPSTVDQAMRASILACHNAIMLNGGWKIPICSEIGWPSNNIGIGITREQQAHELAKVHIVEQSYGVPMTIIHNTFDTSWNDADSTEAHYGIVRPDWTPKPSFYTTREVNNQTNGAIHLGKAYFPDDNIQMHLFARDNAVHAALWTKGNDTEVTLNGGGFKYYDEVGNVIDNITNTISVSEPITYVHGLDKSYAYTQIADNFNEIISDNIGNFKDCENAEGFAEAKALVLSSVEDAEKITSMPSADEAIEIIDNHYGKAAQIIDMYKNRELKIEFKRFTALLSLHHMLGEKYINLYMLCDDRTPEYDYEAKLAEAEKFIADKKGDNTLAGALSVWKYARNYRNNINKILEQGGTNPMKNGYINAMGKASIVLSELSMKLADAETVGYTNVLLQLPSSQSKIDLGREQTILFSLYNYRRKTPLCGHIEIYSPDGECIGKSETVKLDADTSTQVPVNIVIEEIHEGNYIMKFKEDDVVIVERIAPIVVKEQLKISFAPIMKTVEELETVTLRIENVYGSAIKAEIKMTPRCDWEISNGTQSIDIADKEVQYINFPVTQKVKEPFNFYTFDIVITNESGNVIYKKYLPLDFTIVVKADKSVSPADFTGDISDWSDAYPIYADTPQNPEDYAEWQDEDVGARMMMKWDEEYYYILCDVYDQFHANMQIGSNIWNGDSLQLDWDTLNDKSVDTFKPDDYEYGFALTENGPQVYSWQAGPSAVGTMPGEWMNAFDSREEKLTRYYIRIPADNLKPLDFVENKVFGFNFLVNDADFTTREKDIEYTWGISVVKDPSSWENFKLVPLQTKPEGDTKIPLPMNLDGIKTTVITTESVFDDIEGHWAEEYIKKLAHSGIVNGVDGRNFEPDRSITRAEFVTALINASGEKLTEVNDTFSDVSAESWYAPYVRTAKRLGWIADEIGYINFYPEKEITREEAAYMVSCWFKQKSKNTFEYRSMNGITDISAISPWAADSIQTLFNAEIMCGDTSGRINPQNSITRAEMSKIISAALEK